MTNEQAEALALIKRLESAYKASLPVGDLWNLCAESADAIERLHAENEALRADAERLDYLDTLTKRVQKRRPMLPISSDMHFSGGRVSLYVRTGIGAHLESGGTGETVRDAIDQARGKQ